MHLLLFLRKLTLKKECSEACLLASLQSLKMILLYHPTYGTGLLCWKVPSCYMPDLGTAFAYLFGLLYAMNIDYPKEMKYTFEAIHALSGQDSQNAIMLHNPPDLGTAFAYLFGLLYAMNIDYPKEMKYTYEAIQTIFFELGSVLKSPLPLK
ncbi:hypothetical protein N1851_000274 [Merluccius polli]|uniref:Uncharacterized protein n=1 Tax=Merluccius polli TaxID=89951 RepID=A0AA47PD92_MERPO|nr:hypothetical protein N1851_000274 [Merluccius polli]